MNFHPSEKIAVFIDGAALYRTAKQLGFEIDWKLLREFFVSKGRVVRLHYYTLVWTEENEDDKGDKDYVPMRPLLDYLSYNGYSVISTVAQQYTDQGGESRRRGIIGVDLAVDAMQLAPQVDHFVMVMGGGEYRKLFQTLQNQGKKITLVGTITTGGMLADILRRTSDDFIEVDKIKNAISRQEKQGLPFKK